MSAWEYQYWHDRLHGIPAMQYPNEPQLGFYREPRKESYGSRKTFRPVAYYLDPKDGTLRCRVGDENVNGQRALELWTRVGHHPVSEADYRNVAQHGGLWPDEHELVEMQSNLPPPEDSFEGLRDEIEPLVADAKRRLKEGPIQDQAEADRYANLGDRLAELSKMVEEQRKAERKPHDDACIEIQKKWVPLRDLAETYKDLKRVLITPWLNKLSAEQQKEAEAAAAAGEPAAADARRPRAGTRGRAQTLKSTKKAKITDYAVCLEFFKDSDDIKSCVQMLANRAVRAGITVPGAEVLEEQSAV